MDDATASAFFGPDATLTAIALRGPALHYAEVIQDPDGTQALRRLGVCDFDFNVDEAVLGLTGPTHLDVVIEAVKDVFRVSTAKTLLVAVHPTGLPSFFSPLPEGLAPPQRYEQLRQEAALLADVSATQPVRIRAVPVRTETLVIEQVPAAHRWHHVLHVPEPVHARLALIGKALGVGTYDLVDSTQAAAAVVRALDARSPIPMDAQPFTLALGAYPSHVEMAVVHGGAWYHGHHGPIGAPEDAAYFAAAMLERVGLSTEKIGRFVLYGEMPNPEHYLLLADLLGCMPQLLDPLAVYNRTPAGADPAALAAYVPCLGAVLR
ncbi:MAG: hypothetical protein HKN04_14930 [Rhodothermaceae bacterium]|nr:hypothetical protein [Rhodothermaceae bacterium]